MKYGTEPIGDEALYDMLFQEILKLWNHERFNIARGSFRIIQKEYLEDNLKSVSFPNLKIDMNIAFMC